MTTNVTDVYGRIMAADSRWSFVRDTFVLYVDVRGYSKVQVSAEGYSFVFAGDGMLIDQWKQWICQPNRDLPPFERQTEAGEVLSLSVIAVEIGTEIVQLNYGQEIEEEGNLAFFAGSGAEYAYHCWQENSCAKTAIETAKERDVYSGGDVLACNLTDGTGIEPSEQRLADVHELSLQEGFVMYRKNESDPVSFSEAIAVTHAAEQDPNVRDLLKDIRSGAATACSPCRAMTSPPDKKAQDKARNALMAMFNL